MLNDHVIVLNLTLFFAHSLSRGGHECAPEQFQPISRLDSLSSDFFYIAHNPQGFVAQGIGPLPLNSDSFPNGVTV